MTIYTIISRLAIFALLSPIHLQALSSCGEKFWTTLSQKSTTISSHRRRRWYRSSSISRSRRIWTLHRHECIVKLSNKRGLLTFRYPHGTARSNLSSELASVIREQELLRSRAMCWDIEWVLSRHGVGHWSCATSKSRYVYYYIFNMMLYYLFMFI